MTLAYLFLAGLLVGVFLTAALVRLPDRYGGDIDLTGMRPDEHIEPGRKR